MIFNCVTVYIILEDLDKTLGRKLSLASIGLSAACSVAWLNFKLIDHNVHVSKIIVGKTWIKRYFRDIVVVGGLCLKGKPATSDFEKPCPTHLRNLMRHSQSI